MSRDRFSPYEFALVISMSFGYFIVLSLYALISWPQEFDPTARDAFSTAGLLRVATLELIMLPAIAGVLYVRGWRLSDFPIGVGKLTSALGVGAFGAGWMFDSALQAILGQLFSTLQSTYEAAESYKPHHPPDLVAVYLVSIINPVYEEVFVCGYVMAALAPRFGMTTAINVSVIIRTSYHLYQGIAALPFHLFYGLMQAYLFARFGRLWPLIVSHALFDFFAFAMLIY